MVASVTYPNHQSWRLPYRKSLQRSTHAATAVIPKMQGSAHDIPDSLLDVRLLDKREAEPYLLDVGLLVH